MTSSLSWMKRHYRKCGDMDKEGAPCEDHAAFFNRQTKQASLNESTASVLRKIVNLDAEH